MDLQLRVLLAAAWLAGVGTLTIAICQAASCVIRHAGP